MSEPKVLEVSATEKPELEKGESGLSEASVGTEARESRQSESAQTGVNLTNLRGVATGNTEERSLRVTRETPSGVYVRRDGAGEGFSRSVDDKKQIVNMILVNEVKKLIAMSDAELKAYFDKLIEDVKKGQYVEVDTTVYPTLEDFLASTGKQGTVYLYPVGNSANNYYQYIWENGIWKSLGTTELDLSNYYTKQEADPRMFNNINASDIVNNTLTQAQYDLITNGKPTLIKGNLLSLENSVILNWHESTNYWLGNIIGLTSAGVTQWKSCSIQKSTKILAVDNIGITLNGLARSVQINGLDNVNRKRIPTFPTTNTEKQVPVIAPNGGSLAWEDIQTLLQSVPGYDATKNQTLKNTAGTISWVDD